MYLIWARWCPFAFAQRRWWTWSCSFCTDPGTSLRPIQWRSFAHLVSMHTLESIQKQRCRNCTPGQMCLAAWRSVPSCLTCNAEMFSESRRNEQCKRTVLFSPHQHQSHHWRQRRPTHLRSVSRASRRTVQYCTNRCMSHQSVDLNCEFYQKQFIS